MSNERNTTLALTASINHESTKADNLVLRHHLCKMLEEIEGQFDTDPKLLSYEVLEEYLMAAEYMTNAHGRKPYRINEVKEYLDID